VPDPIVVVPTFNERENLTALIDAVTANGYQMLIVDDASPDGTGALADELAETLAGVQVLHRPAKQGLGPAYAAGFAEALRLGADIVGQMDADFSHDPADLPRLMQPVSEGADVVIGSRYVPGGSTPDWATGRRLLSSGGNRYARAMLGSRIRDLTGGFRMWRAAVLESLRPETCRASGYAFQVEMAWRAERAGRRVVEVPIVFRDRRVGESKMDRRIVAEAMRLVTGWGIRRVTRRLP
jgi:dolichol-phosphate mannosyltransferase